MPLGRAAMGSPGIALLRRGQINLPAFLAELLAHLRHARLGFAEGELLSPSSASLRKFEIAAFPRKAAGCRLRGGKISNFLGDLHRAEFWPAHRAEVGGLGAFGGEGLVVILLGGVGVEAEVELVAPAEFEPESSQRLRQAGGRRGAM